LTPLKKSQPREEDRYMWGRRLRPHPHIYLSLVLECSFFSALFNEIRRTNSGGSHLVAYSQVREGDLAVTFWFSKLALVHVLGGMSMVLRGWIAYDRTFLYCCDWLVAKPQHCQTAIS